jgi:hypothetical protein
MSETSGKSTFQAHNRKEPPGLLPQTNGCAANQRAPTGLPVIDEALCQVGRDQVSS